MKQQLNEIKRMQQLAGVKSDLSGIKDDTWRTSTEDIYFYIDQDLGAMDEKFRTKYLKDIINYCQSKIVEDNLKETQLNEAKDINQHKEEALDVVNDFIDEFEPQGLFEFIPDLENYNIDPSTNSLSIEEFASVYLIPNKGPIPNEVKEFMADSNDGEINEEGPTWKKYPKGEYYYIVMS